MKIKECQLASDIGQFKFGKFQKYNFITKLY